MNIKITWLERSYNQLSFHILQRHNSPCNDISGCLEREGVVEAIPAYCEYCSAGWFLHMKKIGIGMSRNFNNLYSTGTT